MEFLTKNLKLIVGVFVGLALAGIIWTVAVASAKQKETQAQEKFSQIEADYSKYKDNLGKANQIANQASQAAKNPKEAAKGPAVDKKAELELQTLLTGTKTKLTTDLFTFIDSNAKSVATSMAALYLSELLLSDKKMTEAMAVLRKVENSSNDLTSILIQKKIGALLADENQCDEAMKVWDKILKINSAKFAFSEIKIMQSLCYQKNNNLTKAEEILNSIKNDKSEASAEYVQSAEKILRLIRFKKASGT
jgi:tetratricopeptide (TPR) repeat protein